MTDDWIHAMDYCLLAIDSLSRDDRLCGFIGFGLVVIAWIMPRTHDWRDDITHGYRKEWVFEP